MKLLLSLLVLLAALVALPAHATYPLTSDLAGVVVDAEQRPIAGATVVIWHMDTGRVVIKKTNRQGRYLAKNLRSDGRYQVAVVANQGSVVFKPGTLDLGERMRRNAVLGADALNPPSFMRSWQWRQDAGNTVPVAASS